MSELLQAKILDVCPSPYGYAVFIKADGKIFVIYVDRTRGAAIQFALDGYKAERPLTHEFVTHLLDGLDCKIKSAVIYHVDDGTFFTKLLVEMDNELGKKIIEVDGRPSDTMTIAVRTGAPIYVTAKVLEGVPDMSEAFKKIKGDE